MLEFLIVQCAVTGSHRHRGDGRDGVGLDLEGDEVAGDLGGKGRLDRQRKGGVQELTNVTAGTLLAGLRHLAHHGRHLMRRDLMGG